MLHKGLDKCPNCKRILRWLPIRRIVFGEYGRSWFGDPYTSIGVEPYEFYVWIDHNFPMEDESRIILDDGIPSHSGGIPINRKLYFELLDDPNVSHRDLDRGYLEHTDCKVNHQVHYNRNEDL